MAEDSRGGEGEGEGDGELVDDTVALSELEEDAWDMRGACLPLKNLPGCLPLGIRTAEPCCGHRQGMSSEETCTIARALPALQLKMQFREQALVAPVYDRGVKGSGRGWAGRSGRPQIKSGRMASMLFHSPTFFFFFAFSFLVV